ncbi:hypothetical protein BVG16_01065 [Paenibacillus selenitireducens]|uniref:Carboxymuconolactone decarboxylase-like domain-containing protein n=2 Tax=Paenibacillus selenitireducens TaxID=1324314 RepID=A0A1T2XMD0_9BACL|nr:hypothetical protein BVG16_01065 [Paenibacillus selenitireducens]
MPFVRVSYLENQYESGQLKLISCEIMNALIAHFRVPEEDYFQVFHAHHGNEFYYSPNYLGVERSDGLLYIQITLKSGRSTTQKTSFYHNLATRLSDTVHIRTEDVFVILVDTELEDWTFGNGIAQMIQPIETDPAEPKAETKHRTIHSKAREVFGDIAPAFVRYSEEVLFEDVWRRSQLSLRERSLITIAALVAEGHTEQLPYHLKLAQENGLTQEEIIEAMTHLAFYAGWPRAASAMQVVKNLGS